MIQPLEISGRVKCGGTPDPCSANLTKATTSAGVGPARTASRIVNLLFAGDQNVLVGGGFHEPGDHQQGCIGANRKRDRLTEEDEQGRRPDGLSGTPRGSQRYPSAPPMGGSFPVRGDSDLPSLRIKDLRYPRPPDAVPWYTSASCKPSKPPGDGLLDGGIAGAVDAGATPPATKVAN